MIVGVDDNGFVSVYRMNDKDIQSSEGHDATLALANLRGGPQNCSAVSVALNYYPE